MQIPKFNKSVKYKATEFLIYMVIAVVLFLSLTNLANYFSPRKVLSVQVVNSFDDSYKKVDYWVDFLEKNPSYIPGWLEIGRTDVVVSIDPNYPLP